MRRAFVFSLARVRRVREVEERLARAAWGEARAVARAAELERERRAEELRAARASLLDALEAGALDPVRLQATHTGLDGGTRRLRRAHEQALTLAQRAERLAEAWRERERDRRALSKLEERRRTRHAAELERADGLEADERALARRFAAARAAAEGPLPGAVKPGPESADQGGS